MAKTKNKTCEITFKITISVIWFFFLGTFCSLLHCHKDQVVYMWVFTVASLSHSIQAARKRSPPGWMKQKIPHNECLIKIETLAKKRMCFPIELCNSQRETCNTVFLLMQLRVVQTCATLKVKHICWLNLQQLRPGKSAVLLSGRSLGRCIHVVSYWLKACLKGAML